MSDITLDGIEPSPLSLPLDSFQENPTDRKVQDAARRLIDLAQETILAGAGFEEVSTKKIHAMETQSNEIIGCIDLLLDFSKEASALNADKPKVTEKMREIHKKLEAKGTHLLDLSKEIDKEQLSAVKAAVGSHIDKLRTQIQQTFTKMQTVIQNLSSVNDSIKKMIAEQSDLVRNITRRYTKQ